LQKHGVATEGEEVLVQGDSDVVLIAVMLVVVKGVLTRQL